MLHLMRRNFKISINSGPDRDDLLGEFVTDEHGLFQVSGATKEVGDIQVSFLLNRICFLFLDPHKIDLYQFYQDLFEFGREATSLDGLDLRFTYSFASRLIHIQVRQI